MIIILKRRGYAIYPEYYFLVVDKREREKERGLNFRLTPLRVTRKRKKWNKSTLRTNVSRDILHHSYIRASTNERIVRARERDAERAKGERGEFHQTSAHAIRELIRFAFLTSFHRPRALISFSTSTTLNIRWIDHPIGSYSYAICMYASLSRIAFNARARQPHTSHLTRVQALRNYSPVPGREKKPHSSFFYQLRIAEGGRSKKKKDRMKLSSETANFRVKSEIISDNPALSRHANFEAKYFRDQVSVEREREREKKFLYTCPNKSLVLFKRRGDF